MLDTTLVRNITVETTILCYTIYFILLFCLAIYPIDVPIGEKTAGEDRQSDSDIRGRDPKRGDAWPSDWDDRDDGSDQDERRHRTNKREINNKELFDVKIVSLLL